MNSVSERNVSTFSSRKSGYNICDVFCLVIRKRASYNYISST